jgi:hypothetical protein
MHMPHTTVFRIQQYKLLRIIHSHKCGAVRAVKGISNLATTSVEHTPAWEQLA